MSSLPSRVHLLIAGGTIAMSGSPARPSLEVIERLAQDAGAAVEAEVFATVPSVHLTGEQALGLCRRAAELGRAGEAVVVTCGTDLLEELAFLCDLIYDGDAPIVFTGAMRIASAPGADGPANLAAAVALAASRRAFGLGVLVVFAGGVHAARYVRKASSTSVDGFASPLTGPLGRVEEAVFVRRWAPERLPAIDVADLDAGVEILTAGLASGPALVEAVAAVCDGLVVSLPGAGHTPPAFFAALAEVAAARPVVAVPRPWQGALLHDTYGYEGSEVDLRASPILCAGSLSAPAARIGLMAALGAGLRGRELEAFFARYD